MNKRQKRFLTQLLCTIVTAMLVTGCTLIKEFYPVNTIAVMPENSQFEVDFIDVGQADSSLIMCDGKSMLIDGGNANDSDLIATYLNKKGIKHLDYVVCTHAHEDHCGGLSGALSTVTADTIYAPVTEANTKAYKNFVKKANEQGIELSHPNAGDEFNLGSSRVKFLGPITEEVKDLNNTSLVVKVSYGETDFLFTGDAEREEEQDILKQGYDLSADVLKVGHHGSESSTSYPFLREVMPQYAVISCGKGNDYGHPHEPTLSRLADAGCEILRTDESGDIIMTSDGNKVEIKEN